MTVTIKGGENLATFLEKVRKQKAKVDIGFFPEAKYVDGTQVATVAIKNEFGEIKNGKQFIPPRPFLLPTFNEQKEKWKRLLYERVKSQGEQINVKAALDYIGVIAVDDVRQKIDWWASTGVPRNADYTIEKKGFDSPLIETGHLRESVTSKTTI